MESIWAFIIVASATHGSYSPLMDWINLLSRRRLGSNSAPADSDARTDFQRDFDRIVFSSAFRRMQDKTQVFPLSENDYIRTRLTHSLEVSSVGRTLGTLVGEGIVQRHGLNEHNIVAADVGAVVAAACLAHDIGNPPFGHAGEDAIREWFQTSDLAAALLEPLNDSQREDFLAFEGNAQGFRVLCRLQNPDNAGGMQLTCATLGTFTKYPRASLVDDLPAPSIAFKKFGVVQQDLPLFREATDILGMVRLSPEHDAWYRHPLAWLLEAADDICYHIIDIEDGYRLGHLSYAAVRDLLGAVVGADDRVWTRLKGISCERQRIEYLRARSINSAVDQVFRCFMDHDDTLLDVGFPKDLLQQLPAADALEACKATALQHLYYSNNVVEIAAAGFEVLGGLLEAFGGAVEEVSRRGDDASARGKMLVNLVPDQFLERKGHREPDPYSRLLGVTDFVSGMTDSYAVSLFKKITGISLPGR